MKRAAKTMVSSLLLLAAVQLFAVEHPGTIPSDSSCSSCHADKLRGKSVHSIMEAPCTVCHLVQTDGDMTTVSLAMPREQICSACHEKPVMMQQHSRPLKGECLDCHDAHSSNRRLLLLDRPEDFARVKASVPKSPVPPVILKKTGIRSTGQSRSRMRERAQ